MEYSIGDLSKISRVGGKTLHQYHMDGLVVPTRIDKFSNRRFYNARSLHRVEVVHRLYMMGIPSGTIKEILSRHKETGHFLQSLRSTLSHSGNPWEKYGLTEEKIHAILRASSENRSKAGEVTAKVLPDLRVAGKQIKAIPGNLCSCFTSLRETCGGTVMGDPITLFHDDHQFDDEMNMECCLPVNKDISSDDILCHDLKGARAVSVEYSGAASGIWKGYQKIIDYLNTNNLAIQTPSREVILEPGTDQQPDQSEQNIHVEIQFLTGDPNDPNFTRDISRPGFGINAMFDL